MQDYMFWDVRASAILTNSYVPGTVLNYTNANPALRNQLNILVNFTKGLITSAEIKVEYSSDGVNFFQDTFEAISAGTSTLSLGEYTIAATGNYIISIPIKAAYIRISAKGTGTVTSSLMEIDAILAVV